MQILKNIAIHISLKGNELTSKGDNSDMNIFASLLIHCAGGWVGGTLKEKTDPVGANSFLLE